MAIWIIKYEGIYKRLEQFLSKSELEALEIIESSEDMLWDDYSTDDEITLRDFHDCIPELNVVRLHALLNKRSSDIRYEFSNSAADTDKHAANCFVKAVKASHTKLDEVVEELWQIWRVLDERFSEITLGGDN
ncbi:MAG: hypothetical protein Q9209_006455 [Squamulea sp. 1 TL-2023]